MSDDERFTLFAARAVFDERLTAMDVRVLAALGTYTNKQGWCRPSQTTIANRLKTSRPRVNASVRSLVSAGYVQAVSQSSERRGREVNLYRVLLDASAPEAVEAAVQEIETERNSIDSPPVSPADRGVSAGGTPPVSPADIELTQEINTPLTPQGGRGRRLPADWQPRAEEIAFGVAGGLSDAETRSCAEHFRDHFEASSRASARKLNWDLAFKNWLRTAISDARRGRRPVVSAPASFDWAAAERIFREHGYWNRAANGPAPDEPGYRGLSRAHKTGTLL